MSRRPSLKKSSAAGTTKKAFGSKSAESSAEGSSAALRGLSVFGRLFAMLVPSLIIAAIVAGLGIHLSDSWQVGAASGQSANEEARQELLAGEKAQSHLSRANDAMSAANTSAGLLKSGVDQLDDGAGKLKDGSAQARAGSAELSNGMDQVADGTRQLGSGAKQVAGGVSEAVNGVIALRRYQAAAAAVVDATIPTLVGNDPDTVRTRTALQELSKTLHDSRQTDQAIKDLHRLQSGANEISRQLNPGGAYYSGVMKAQSGSKQLASGLVQLDNGMGELVSGVSKLQGVATTNERNTKKAHTAMLELMKLSNDQKVAQMAEEQLALQSQGEKPSLPLGQAYLVSALLALAAAVAWWSRLRLGRKEIAAVWLLMTVISATAILTTMTGLNAMVGTFMVSTLAVSSAALLLGSGAVVLLLGRKWGLLLNIFLVFVQASVSGFVWLTEWPSRMSRFFDSLMPVSYITSALAAIGNGGDPAMAWLANGALLALTTIAIFVILTVLRRRPDAGIPTDIHPVKVGRKVPATVTAPASVVQDSSAVETGVFTRVSPATPFAPMDTGSLADLEVATTMPEDGTEDLPTQIIHLDEQSEQPRDQRR